MVKMKRSSSAKEINLTWNQVFMKFIPAFHFYLEELT